MTAPINIIFRFSSIKPNNMYNFEVKPIKGGIPIVDKIVINKESLIKGLGIKEKLIILLLRFLLRFSKFKIIKTIFIIVNIY